MRKNADDWEMPINLKSKRMFEISHPVVWLRSLHDHACVLMTFAFQGEEKAGSAADSSSICLFVMLITSFVFVFVYLPQSSESHRSSYRVFPQLFSESKLRPIKVSIIFAHDFVLISNEIKIYVFGLSFDLSRDWHGLMSVGDHWFRYVEEFRACI